MKNEFTDEELRALLEKAWMSGYHYSGNDDIVAFMDMLLDIDEIIKTY
jgi:hypothetical protein